MQIYASPSSVSSGSFKPPVPPGNKYKWAPAQEVIPHNEVRPARAVKSFDELTVGVQHAYYPMYASSATKIN